jgi:uncharacterized protein (TIGR00725 family)
VFQRLSTGVYVIGVAHDGHANAFTAAWLTPVSFEPPLLVLSVNPEHASYPLLQRSGTFAVSVLGRGQLELAAWFGRRSGRDTDKLAGQPVHPRPSGAPVLRDAVAFVECRVEAQWSAGDHELFLARAVDGSVLRSEDEPLGSREIGNLDGADELYPPMFAAPRAAAYRREAGRRPIIGVMGASASGPDILAQAERLGRLAAEAGWAVLTGGRPVGVMEAACAGARQVPGSLTIGILPSGPDGPVSAQVDVAVFTGMGDARNAINVLSSDVVVACGVDGAGTASEVALALKAGRPTVLLSPSEAAGVFFRSLAGDRVRVAASPEAAITLIEERFGIPRRHKG